MTGAAKMQYVATPEPAAQPSIRSLRNGHASPYPAAASTTTSGVASDAVDAKSGGKSAATMTTARPAGRRSGPGSGEPDACSSRRPQPTASAASTSGKTSQGISTPALSANRDDLPGRDQLLRPLGGGVRNLDLVVGAGEGNVHAGRRVRAVEGDAAVLGMHPDDAG